MNPLLIAALTYLLIGAIAFLHIGYRTEYFVDGHSWSVRIFSTVVFVATWYSTFIELGVRQSQSTSNKQDLEEQLENMMNGGQ